MRERGRTRPPMPAPTIPIDICPARRALGRSVAAMSAEADIRWSRKRRARAGYAGPEHCKLDVDRRAFDLCRWFRRRAVQAQMFRHVCAAF